MNPGWKRIWHPFAYRAWKRRNPREAKLVEKRHANQTKPRIRYGRSQTQS